MSPILIPGVPPLLIPPQKLDLSGLPKWFVRLIVSAHVIGLAAVFSMMAYVAWYLFTLT
jgi:hypothetical protein